MTDCLWLTACGSHGLSRSLCVRSRSLCAMVMLTCPRMLFVLATPDCPTALDVGGLAGAVWHHGSVPHLEREGRVSPVLQGPEALEAEARQRASSHRPLDSDPWRQDRIGAPILLSSLLRSALHSCTFSISSPPHPPLLRCSCYLSCFILSFFQGICVYICVCYSRVVPTVPCCVPCGLSFCLIAS